MVVGIYHLHRIGAERKRKRTIGKPKVDLGWMPRSSWTSRSKTSREILGGFSGQAVRTVYRVCWSFILLIKQVYGQNCPALPPTGSGMPKFFLIYQSGMPTRAQNQSYVREHTVAFFTWNEKSTTGKCHCPSHPLALTYEVAQKGWKKNKGKDRLAEQWS